MNILIDIRDEERLLLALCRLEITEVQAKQSRQYIKGITDWEYFMSLANDHGVSALAYHNLEKYNLTQFIPGTVSSFLRNALLKSLARNEFNREAIHGVLTLLNRENIKTVLLKGMALELTVYGNEGLRQMSDVDVLISKEECIKARDILISNGFTSIPLKSVLHQLISEHLGKHLPSLIRNGASVEIHHDLFGIKNHELTRLIHETSFEYSLKEAKVYIPRPQVLFLYLVRHLWLHEINNESQLRLYSDLVILIEKYGDTVVNGDLLELASVSGMRKVLATRLHILRDIWEISFPSEVDKFITKWHDPLFRERFLFYLRSPKGNTPPDKSWNYRHFVSEIPGLHRRILYVAGDVFPSIRFMKNRYKCKSGWKALLYYPHRLGKVLFLFQTKLSQNAS